MASIRIYGAKTLDRYTKQILSEGFRNNDWDIAGPETKGTIDAVIFQLHGAPQSEKEDRDILEIMKHSLSVADKIKTVVVLHRPDELQKYADLREILTHSSKKIGLVFFGDKHINDDFFPSRNIIKKIIPHGFFQLDDYLQTDPIIIGSHTTWGEMRSVEHALKLLAEIFTMYKNGEKRLIGYLGGKPESQLDMHYLHQIWESSMQIPVNFLDAREYTLNKALQMYSPTQNIIIINPVDAQPSNFAMTFNIQMYYFGKKVRTGESSGTLHASTGIPVILEMNGAEIIEDLRVVKIPYRSVSDINTIDFTTGARKIVELIKDNSHVALLKHNLKQSLLWNNTKIVANYIALFNEL